MNNQFVKMTHKFRQKAIAFAFLLIPPLLLFIDVDWLNEQHTVCLFQNVFGVKCWGCGMTRAILSSLHLDFYAAWQYNKLFVIVLPLLIFVYFRILIKLLQAFPKFKSHFKRTK